MTKTSGFVNKRKDETENNVHEKIGKITVKFS